jgi:hypothetical protein
VEGTECVARRAFETAIRLPERSSRIAVRCLGPIARRPAIEPADARSEDAGIVAMVKAAAVTGRHTDPR